VWIGREGIACRPVAGSLRGDHGPQGCGSGGWSVPLVARRAVRPRVRRTIGSRVV